MTTAPNPAPATPSATKQIESAELLLSILEDATNVYALRDLLGRLKGEERQARRAELAVIVGGGEADRPRRNELPVMTEYEAVRAGTLVRPSYLRAVPDDELPMGH